MVSLDVFGKFTDSILCQGRNLLSELIKVWVV